MKKPYAFYLLSSFLLFSLAGFAQKKDSSATARNKFVVSAGIGNNPYKLENSSGGATSGAYLKPGLAYITKSGFSLSAYTYALLGQSANGLFEYDVTPAYDFDKGKAFSFGLAYTRYFFNGNSDFEASPLKNEFYGYLNYNQLWLQPGIALDAEAGSYTDSLGNTQPASDVAVILSLTHQFSFTSLLTDNDELDLSPDAGLTIGTDKFVRSFGSARFIRHAKSVNHIIRSKKNSTSGSHGNKKSLYTNSYTNSQAQFTPRTLELSLDLNYTIGNFSFEPQYYYDIPLNADETGASYFLATVSYAF